MNNVASITRHLEKAYPAHHVVLVQNGWPHALKYELIGTPIALPNGLEELERVFGVEDVFVLRGLSDVNTIEGRS